LRSIEPAAAKKLVGQAAGEAKRKAWEEQRAAAAASMQRQKASPVPVVKKSPIVCL
jgi:hypothetical protein